MGLTGNKWGMSRESMGKRIGNRQGMSGGINGGITGECPENEREIVGGE
jgi:hypothetical protein